MIGINQPLRRALRRNSLSRSAVRVLEHASRIAMRSGYGLATVHNVLGVFPAKPPEAPGLILFKIVSAQTSRCQATAKVIGRPCGAPRVLHEDDDEQVTVYDVMCCAFADETDSSLVGRLGWASLVKLDDSWQECCSSGYGYGYDDIPTSECIWGIVSLCCPDACLA